MLGRCIVDGAFGVSQDAAPTSLPERLAALRETILLAAGPGVLVEYLIGDEIPDVECAAHALDDVILNIVGNASHAMGTGGRLVISAMRGEVTVEGPPCTVLRIADNGCGMSAETVKRAFEPRFTTKPVGKGSGIGLATVAAFTRSAGGSVELESYPGVGTIVTVRLPAMIRMAPCSCSRP
ncbi:sensor histidine kinase [Sphingomonas glacialis]|nr:HAMP domain-containing sensor histidine kinase [Sphingomonas glacialis]